LKPAEGGGGGDEEAGGKDKEKNLFVHSLRSGKHEAKEKTRKGKEKKGRGE